MLGDQGQMSPREGHANLCPRPLVHAVTSSIHAQCRSWAVDRASAHLALGRPVSNAFHANGRTGKVHYGCGDWWWISSVSVSPSDLRENIQSLIGRGHEDSMADQEANRWGRSGKDPNYYRPAGCLTNTEHPPFSLRRLCADSGERTWGSSFP